jgi:hypothetical protein
LRSRLTAPAILCVLAFASVARAEPSELERARALFDEAGELERRGQWILAQERLRAALRIRETPHLRYALGWALENGDRLVDARTEYAVALRLGQRDGAEEVTRLASARLAEVDRKLPILQVRVRGALAPGSHVSVDGREVLVHGEVGNVPVDPGPHTVEVVRRGKATSDQIVTLKPGVLSVVEVRGDEGAVAADTHASTNPRADASARTEADTRGGATAPWVLVASGGALSLGAVVLFVSSSGDASARDDATRRWCDATACVGGSTATRAETADATAYRREASDAATRGNTKQIVGAILGGVGLVGIATGAYLLLTGRERDDRPSPMAKARLAEHAEGSLGASRAEPLIARLRVDAAPLPGGGLAGASLTF